MLRLLLPAISAAALCLAATDGHAYRACGGDLFSLPQAKQTECLKLRVKAIQKAEDHCNTKLNGRPASEISRCITRELERAGF
jgi:hypothetical protein